MTFSQKEKKIIEQFCAHKSGSFNLRLKTDLDLAVYLWMLRSSSATFWFRFIYPNE